MGKKNFLHILLFFSIIISKSYGQPDIPFLDSVSVDSSTHHVILGWNPSIDPKTKGYIIYQSLAGGLGLPIDTVFGQNTTTYLDVKLDPTVKSQSYRIAALDSNKKSSAMGNIHSTIFLNEPTNNPCDSSISLQWSPYIGFSPPLTLYGGYRIFARENNGKYILAGTTLGAVTSFTHQNVHDKSNYCYIIQAFDSSGIYTSSSNGKCILFSKPVEPKFVYLRSATVENNKFIRLTIYGDKSATFSKFEIFRSDTSTGPFKLLATFSNSNPDFTYLDSDSSINVQNKTYYYKIIAYDSCEYKSLTSNLAKTMLLFPSQANEDLVNTLNWTDYEGFQGNTAYYDIYRKVDNNNFELAAQIPSASLTYQDVIKDFLPSQGIFTYYIAAIENGPDIYSFIDTSRSNEITIKQKAIVWIPNAFTPGGLNPYFFPVCSFVDASTYHFIVFDRWGEQIFESKTPNDGWDGKVKNKDAPEDIYSYYLSFRNAEGVIEVRKGLVTLVR